MTIKHNTEKHRFETELSGGLAHLDYEFYHGAMNLFHTFVPPKERHQGIAFAMVKVALEYATAEHLKVIAGCPTVSIFINQNPEYESLLTNQN